MAIRLASAIGQQREPIGILGGLDDAINKTGDAIQAANQRKAAEEAKKRDAALQAVANIDTEINALPEDNKRYNKEAKRLVGEAFSLFANGASPSELLAKNKEIENTLAPMKNRYEKDYADYQNIVKFSEESKNKRDLSEAEAFLTGKSRAEIPMSAQAPTDRAMPVNKEDSDITEVVDVQERKPYWEMDWQEREKVAPAGAYTEVVKRAKDITGNFNDAIDGYTGGKFDPQGRFTNLQDVLKAGGLDKQQVVIDYDGIAKEKSAFISSFGSELGDVKTKQYWNTLTNLAAKRGRDAGLTGDRLKAFVEQNVKTVAAQDFDNFVNQEIEKTKIKKIDQDPDKVAKDSEGFTINIGGGGENKLWKFGKPVKINIREGATTLVTTDKEGNETRTPNKKGQLKEYEYISMQTKTPASNPVMVVDGENVYYQGVVKEVGGDEIVKFKFNTKADDGGEDRFVEVGKLKPSTISDIKTNVGEDDFEKAAAVGKYSQKKEETTETKAAAPKAKKIEAKGKKYAGLDADGNPIFK